MTADTPITSMTNTRLQGRWLWIARAIWFVLVTLTVILYVAALPVRYNDLQSTCAAEPCAVAQLKADVAQALQTQYGISLNFYAWYLFNLEIALYLPFLVVALLIFWRKSDDWLAQFVSFMLVSLPLTGPLLDTFARAQPIWVWSLALLRVVGSGSFITLNYIFPDGRVVPRWSSWLVLLSVVALTFASAQPNALDQLSYAIAFLSALALGVAAQVYRYRRVSTPSQRQQTKWVVFGFAALFSLVLVGYVPLFLFPKVFNASSLAAALYAMIQTPFFIVLPLSLLPVTLAISILRYRLWDIDFVINRALVYGTLTALLGGVFAGGFFLLNAILQGVFGVEQNVLAAGASAAILVTIFNPTRRWLRAIVDRHFYGIQIEYTPSPVVTPTDAVRLQFGPYKALEFIGRGGMADVYKTTDTKLNRWVAIKILSSTLVADPEFRKRFEREAKTASALKHPNIVQVFEFGEVDSTPYMVMELINGKDLGDYLHSQGRLHLHETLSLIRPIASALDYAHQQGLVHRDIKPSNVMLDGTRPVLTDFGIAKILGRQTRFTQTGSVLGTFDYIAPEQIQGVADMDARADIYAFGVMTYQMLTGELPFKHQNPGALLMAHMTQPPPDPREIVPDLPRHVVQVIRRAMAKKPNERFATAGEFASEISRND